MLTRKLSPIASTAVATFMAILTTGVVGAAEVDASKWGCERCPFEDGFSGAIGVAAGVVNDDENAFGNYTGWDDDTAYVTGGGAFKYWNEDGYTAELSGFGYNSDAFEANIDAGHQGSWMINIGMERLPIRKLESTESAYSNLSGTPQSLPNSWVRSGSTAGMTDLDSSLRDFDVAWDRETFSLGGQYLFNPNLTFDTEWKYQTKEGKGITWGNFLGNAAQLTKPLDYQTNEFETGINYSGDRWQTRLAYNGSWFSNKNLAHTWENAFTGPDEGRMAGAPDNKAYQLSLAGSFQIFENTHASASVATGKMEQDDSFLSYSINPNLASTPLPRSSLDGEVKTTHLDARLTSTPWKRVRLTGKYRYDERDNDTSVETYSYVLADTIQGVSEENRPYSYEDYTVALFADIRVARELKASFGWDRDTIERKLQEVDKNEEDTFWAKLRFRPAPGVSLDVEGQTAERDSSNYKQIDYLNLDQNPLMRKYNMADRDRDGYKVRLSIQPLDRLSFGMSTEYWDENYEDSDVGLTGANRESIYGDLSYTIGDNITTYINAGREEIDSTMVGAQSNLNPNTALPNWKGKNSDEFNNAGLGFRWNGIREKWGVEFDYQHAKSDGDVKIIQSGLSDSFPSLETKRDTAELGVTYQLRQNMQLRGGWLYERYRSDDWGLDGVEPDTINNVLTWGANSPDYNVSVFTLSFTYDLGKPAPEDD
jgi:MtrB/PioB family decaheme-associated outer membrane protein